MSRHRKFFSRMNLRLVMFVWKVMKNNRNSIFFNSAKYTSICIWKNIHSGKIDSGNTHSGKRVFGVYAFGEKVIRGIFRGNDDWSKRVRGNDR